MKQQRKNLSTKTIVSGEDKEGETEVKTEECYFIMTPIAKTGKTFSDQIGRFPVTSNKGNRYVMIMYEYESNDILVEGLKSRTGDELLRAFKKITEY